MVTNYLRKNPLERPAWLWELMQAGWLFRRPVDDMFEDAYFYGYQKGWLD